MTSDWQSRTDTVKTKEDGKDDDRRVLPDGRVTHIRCQAKDASSVDNWTITLRTALTT